MMQGPAPYEARTGFESVASVKATSAWNTSTKGGLVYRWNKLKGAVWFSSGSLVSSTGISACVDS